MKSLSKKDWSKRDGAKTGTRAGRRRRDLSALEKRRMRGVRLLQEGVWQAEVARRLGVHRQSVSRWAKKLKRGGERALGAGQVGRPARLHREDLRRVERLLKRLPGDDPRLGKPGTRGTRRWTAKQVAELIERECRVKYDVSQAWRILRQLGWSFHPSGRNHPITRKPRVLGAPISGPPGRPGGGGWRITRSSWQRA